MGKQFNDYRNMVISKDVSDEENSWAYQLYIMYYFVWRNPAGSI